VIPLDRDYRYVATRDAIDAVPRAEKEIKERYRAVIAQVALRTIHEILISSPSSVIELVTFYGYVSTTDPATGQPIRPLLLQVSAKGEPAVHRRVEAPAVQDRAEHAGGGQVGERRRPRLPAAEPGLGPRPDRLHGEVEEHLIRVNVQQAGPGPGLDFGQRSHATTLSRMTSRALTGCVCLPGVSVGGGGRGLASR
jgi:hypothetical protein